MHTRFRRHLKLGHLVVSMILLGITGTLIGTTGVLASADTACGCGAPPPPAAVASAIGGKKCGYPSAGFICEVEYEVTSTGAAAELKFASNTFVYTKGGAVFTRVPGAKLKPECLVSVAIGGVGSRCYAAIEYTGPPAIPLPGDAVAQYEMVAQEIGGSSRTTTPAKVTLEADEV